MLCDGGVCHCKEGYHGDQCNLCNVGNGPLCDNLCPDGLYKNTWNNDLVWLSDHYDPDDADDCTKSKC